MALIIIRWPIVFPTGAGISVRTVLNKNLLNFEPPIRKCWLRPCYSLFKFKIFKPGARRHAPGFLVLLLSTNICMHACVSAPEAINN